MNTKKTALSLVSLAAGGLLIAGCSTQSETAAPAPSASMPSATSSACAKSETGGPVEVSPEATCVEVQAGSFALLYSLAVDDMKDARIEVVSGDKSAAVPLRSPESDGDFLMGFVAEQEGKAEIAVYITPMEGTEEKVQELSVTVTPAPEGSAGLPLVDGSKPAGAESAAPADGSNAGSGSDSGWMPLPDQSGSSMGLSIEGSG